MSRFSKIILYAIYFVILAVLVGVIIHSFRNDSTKVPRQPTIAHHQPSSPKTSMAAPKTNPQTIATPTLTNTGPGDVFGLFAAASLGGMLAHRRWLAKRLS